MECGTKMGFMQKSSSTQLGRGSRVGAAPHSWCCRGGASSPGAHAAPCLCRAVSGLGVIAKFCIYNVLAHAYTIKDFLSYVVMSSCVAQIREELVVSIMQGTHEAGIHYFMLEILYLEFSLKRKEQLRLAKEQQSPCSP